MLNLFFYLGHISNIVAVLPTILDERSKEIFLTTKSSCFEGKTKIRGVDYRYALIIIYNNIKQFCSKSIQELLHTLIEISEKCYADANKRSPKFILRLYNITFKHAILCFNLLSNQTVLTNRVMFGIYFHSLTSHLPFMTRLFTPSSLHTEEEERLFSALNSISSSTSSRAKDSVRDNAIIRLQIEQKLKCQQNGKMNMDSKISKLATALGKYRKWINCYMH